jgi:HEXXH motif-containing protein
MPSADRLIRLTAIVAEADVDIAVAEGCGLSGGGCRVADPADGRVVVDYWVPEASNPGADAMKARLASVGIVTDVTEQVEDDSWKRALRDFHQPVVAGRIRVRPPWVAPEAGMLDVVIDPGMAFGTGQHPTTRTSLELIAEVDPDMAAEITALVSQVKLFAGRGMEGLSTPKAFGAIWLKLPEPDQALGWFFEHLVHECSHLQLNALFALDSLLTNPAEINQAPIRPDPRPMFQILHGTFVLARNVRVHSRLHAAHPELGLGAALDRFREQYARGLEVIRKHLKPTDRGRLLMASFAEPGVN